jgi:hypothetical protein
MMAGMSEKVEVRPDCNRTAHHGYLRGVEGRGRDSQSLAPSRTMLRFQMASLQSSPPGETVGGVYMAYTERMLKRVKMMMLGGNLEWFEMGLRVKVSSNPLMSEGTTVPEIGIWKLDVEGGP